MAAALNRTPPLMEHRFNRILCGCPSFRIDRINDGSEVKPLPQAFVVGKTTLADVLSSYGAPADIIDMKGHFALHYQRIFYRGGQISLSLPLKDIIKVSPAFDVAGNLQRYDSAVFIFTPEGILSKMIYGTRTGNNAVICLISSVI
jgi:hypothetical protein